MSDLDDRRMTAAADLIQRLGASSMELRYSEPEEGMDDSPLVWIAIGHFKRYGHVPPQVAAALHPNRALEKLLEQLVDGGTCQHCGRPTALFTEHDEEFDLAGNLCAYTYDPELATYRRSCEGER